MTNNNHKTPLKDKDLYQKYATTYRENLLQDVVPFWLKYSPDNEYGGYFTCLDRKGNVYDTDKFMWLQCRQVWTFSMLFNRVEKKEIWLDAALGGADFLMRNGRDKEGNWYFSVTREGNPLIQPCNIFSDCFAAMAFGQLYTATGDERYATIARDTFSNILRRRKNPKGVYSKSVRGTRPLEGFALPMILTNLVLELEHVLEPAVVNEVIHSGIGEILHKFYRPELGVILENVNADGSFSDTLEGRLVNPGHGLEATWFLMDLGKRINDDQLIKKAVDISLEMIDFGWDTQDEGIFYFMDVKGYPTQHLEWDQKLWWVHLESMIAMSKGYQHTGNEQCWNWFERLHRYCFNRFVDTEYGEWYGYLNRKGEVLINLKGGKWKGCFHVPRALYQLWSVMEQLQQQNPTQPVRL